MDMLTYEEFIEKQESIYQKFRNASQDLVGKKTSPDKHIGKGSFGIVYKHPKNVNDAVEFMSQKFSAIIPTLFYFADSVHTTISDYNLDFDFEPEASVAQSLVDIVEKAAPNITQPTIDYKGWLFNGSSVVAEGYPNEPFYENAVTLVRAAENSGIELRMPWGAHITVARAKAENPITQQALKLISSSPAIGRSCPESLDVVAFYIGKEEVKITRTYKKFDL